MLDELIKHHYNELEKLLRKADENLAAQRTPNGRRRARRQRNAINAACNDMYRAYKA